jgi:transketolase
LLEAFNADSGNKPKLIIANTIKGRGIDSLENITKSHFGHLDKEQFELAIKTINNERLKISGNTNGN